MVLAVAVVAGVAWLVAGRALPSPLFDAPMSQVLLDRDGRLLGARVARDEQWRFPPDGPVPARFGAALIRAEDKRFAFHPGVDPLAVARALYLNLSAGRVRSGASTLSMQVVRLARSVPERSWSEKLLEMLAALRLEVTHDKDEIVELYAAHAPFGGNVVGLEAAAWRYFGRPPAALSWAESALLAVLPNRPARLHLGRGREELRTRRDRLLADLQANGEFDALTLQLALAEPIPERPAALPQLAPRLLDSLAADLPSDSSDSSDGPLRTTIDADLQRAAQLRVRLHSAELRRRGVRNAAALIVGNRPFEVLARVGNSPAAPRSEHASLVDLVTRPRSTGSLLKPFLFAAMLGSGELLPSQLVPDVPTRYADYAPENFDHQYRGAVPAREALTRSLNVPAVRMLEEHGVPRLHALLRRLGLSSLHRPPGHYGLALVLGGAEGTLLELTSMYARLAQIASRNERASSGPRLLLARPESQPIEAMAPIRQAEAWLTLEALTDVRRPDTHGHWREFSSARRIAWKTGTSFGLRDAWAIGTSPDYTIGVWVGNADGEGTPGLTGVSSAAPLLFDLFELVDAEPSGFPRPEQALDQVRVCRDDGYLANSHCESRREWIPRGSHFARTSPHHRRIHVDVRGAYRVDSRCRARREMRAVDVFVLPALQAHFVRQRDPAYRGLPPWHPDCTSASRDSRGDSRPLGLIYPPAGSVIQVPRELDGRRGRVVLEAAHRDPAATLHWHLDGRYLASTRTFHEVAVAPAPGPHSLALVDHTGARVKRAFRVVGEAREADPGGR